jgi:hypothetical protein
MSENYTDFIKKEFEKYSEEDFDIGKTAEFHISRGGKSISDIKKELLNCKFLKAVSREDISGEERYILYHIYNKRRGIKYIITFRNKRIRLITTIPLGRRTILKAEKILEKRFKKINPFDLK